MQHAQRPLLVTPKNVSPHIFHEKTAEQGAVIDGLSTLPTLDTLDDAGRQELERKVSETMLLLLIPSRHKHGRYLQKMSDSYTTPVRGGVIAVRELHQVDAILGHCF